MRSLPSGPRGTKKGMFVALITVRKNAKNKIRDVARSTYEASIFDLSSNFVGIAYPLKHDGGEEFYNYIMESLSTGSTLRFDDQTGIMRLRHHSNHWVEFKFASCRGFSIKGGI